MGSADFTMDMLMKFGGAGRWGLELIGAGQSLQSFVKEAKERTAMPDEAAFRRMCHAWDFHLRAARACGIHLAPKHHLCSHLVWRSIGCKTWVGAASAQAYEMFPHWIRAPPALPQVFCPCVRGGWGGARLVYCPSLACDKGV